MNSNLPISARIRPNSEAAPWVIDEVRNLEARADRLAGALRVLLPLLARDEDRAVTVLAAVEIGRNMKMTIDINEMRRLAQEAIHPVTKGRWIRLFGERTVYDRMEDGCRGIPVVSTDKHPPSQFEAACLDFIAAANPAAVSEIIDRLEAAESEAIEQARLNGMGSEREAALMAKLEAAEKERDTYKAIYNEWASKTEWVQQGVNEGTISAKYLGLHRADVMARLLGEAEKERDEGNRRRLEAADHFAAQTALMKKKYDALRAKIAEMEQQEPVAEWLPLDSGEDTRRD